MMILTIRRGQGLNCSAGTRTDFQLAVAEAVHDMIIDHADRLHMGVQDGGAKKLKTPLFEIFGPGDGLIGERRVVLEGPQRVAQWFSSHPLPHISGKRSMLLPHL